MKTADIINNLCTHLEIPKADLARQLGLHPSSLYRKLSNESMTFEELQKCFDVLGVSMDMQFHCPDGNTLSSQINYDQLMDKLHLLEKELEVANKTVEFHKKMVRDLRTELNSAVGYLELCRRNGTQTEVYQEKLQRVHSNMERIMSYAVGEPLDEPAFSDSEQIEALEGKRVLLVDDNELNRDILKRVLEDYGLLVEETDNGNKAIAAVKGKEAGYYHFLLMDIEMPEMDGYEATMIIRKLPNRIRANVPIIALTADATPETREKASVVGMDDFLVKPVNSARLLGVMSKLL